MFGNQYLFNPPWQLVEELIYLWLGPSWDVTAQGTPRGAEPAWDDVEGHEDRVTF